MIAGRSLGQTTDTPVQLKENKTIVEGTVERLFPSPDGWGADADVLVEKIIPSSDESFLKTKPGAILRVFIPDPDAVRVGHARRMSITVLGGPKGSRAVVQDSEEK